MKKWVSIKKEPLPRDKIIHIKFREEMIMFRNEKSKQYPVKEGDACPQKPEEHPETITVCGDIVGGGQRILYTHISYIEFWEKEIPDPKISRFDLLDL